MRVSAWLVAGLVLATQASAAAADEARLVELVARRTFAPGKHHVSVQAPQAPGAVYFLTVERDGAIGKVEVNGKAVVEPKDLVIPGGRLRRVQVPLQAQNTLRVTVVGVRGLTLAVHGVVPAGALPPGAGRPVAFATLHQETFQGQLPPRVHRVVVAAPTTEGLFTLRAAPAGGPAPLVTVVSWNAEPVLGVAPLVPGHATAESAVVVREQNVLEVAHLGLPGSRVTVTLSGWLVDEAPPTVAWAPLTPPLGPTTPLVATYADAVSGVAADGVRVLLDGAQDVTAAFTVGPAQATSTLAALQALAPAAVSGEHTLTVLVTDRVGLTGEATLALSLGGGAPPVITTPGDLVVEQTSPGGAVVDFTVTATDDDDPAPVVECVPPSGSLFPPGTTTVTCTARDAAGNASQATFDVTVADTQPPSLSLAPADGALVFVDRVEVTVTFSDGGSGVAPGSIVARLDGAPLALAVGDGVATATTGPLAAGAHVLEVTLADHAGNAAGATSTFEVSLPELVAVAALDLPPARAGGGSSRATLLLSNASDRAPLHVRAATLTGPFTLDPPLPPAGLIVLPGAMTSLVVRFSPEALGPAEGALELASNDPARPVHAVALSGEGTRGAVELSLDPGPPDALAAGSAHRVRVRAVDAAGATDAGLRGLIELRTTPAGSPLDGALLLLDEAAQGLAATPPLPLFAAAGPATITAHLVDGADAFELGALAVEVVGAERGRVVVALDPGTYTPGQTLTARVFVDMGPGTAVADALGAYDVRLLFDARRFEVERVLPGPSGHAPPMFVLPGSVRLMGLNDVGALTAPAGPSPLAVGVQELARVELRVRERAPRGDASFAVTVDALTTAAPAAEGSLALTPAGAPGPRPGEVEGQVTVESDREPPSTLALLGTLPRDGEGLVDAVQRVEVVRAVLSEALDPATLEGVTLTLDSAPVPGAAQLGERPGEVVFVPAGPLGPGDYTLHLPAELASAGGAPLGASRASTFRVGPVDDPHPADLDRDGEIAILDVQARRDVVTGRTPGSVPDFPPLFLEGVGDLLLREGDVRTIRVRVVDLDGDLVVLPPEGLPDFVHLVRVTDELFELTIAPPLGGSGGVVDLSALGGGATTGGQLNITLERVNTPPQLVLVEPRALPLVVLEGERLELVFEALDPDLLHPTAPDHVTFALVSPPISNLRPLVVSGPRGERATLAFEPDFTQAGEHRVEVAVTDSQGERATLVALIEVRDVNRPPELSAIAPVEEDLFVGPGDQVTLDFVAVDPDGDDELTVVLMGNGADLLAAEVARRRVRIDGQQQAPGRLTLQLTVLAPLPSEGVTLSAIATDGQRWSEPASRSLWPPLTVSSVSGFAGVVPVGLAPLADDRSASRPFTVTAPLARFTIGRDTEFPDKVWLERDGAPAPNVERIVWTVRDFLGTTLEVDSIHFTERLSFAAGTADGYVLAAEVLVQGQPFVRRVPLSLVEEPFWSRKTLGMNGEDGAPPSFRGTYALDIARVTTVTVPLEGTYRLEGKVVVWRGASDSAAIPTCSTVVVRVAGETAFSDGGFRLDEPVPDGWTSGVAGLWWIERSVVHELYLTAGTHQLEILANGTVERTDSSHGASMGVGLIGQHEIPVTGVLASFLGATLAAPPPTVTLVSTTNVAPGDHYLRARLRVTRPHLVRQLRVMPWPHEQPTGRIDDVRVVEPRPDDPREPIEVDVLLGLLADELRIVGVYVLGSGEDAITTPEVVVATPRDGGSFTAPGLFRVRAVGDGPVTLERMFVPSAPLLPEGARAEDQSLGPDNPYALYFAFGAGLPPDDEEVRASVLLPGGGGGGGDGGEDEGEDEGGWEFEFELESVGGFGSLFSAFSSASKSPLQTLPVVAADQSALAQHLGHVPPLDDWSGDGTGTIHYRLSKPIFFVFRAQAAGAVHPVQVLEDRIVVSVGVQQGLGAEGAPRPRVFPLPGPVAERFEAELRAGQAKANPHSRSTADLFTAGLLHLLPDHETGAVEPREPLDASRVGCDSVIQCWFPLDHDRTGYTLYLDRGDEEPLVPLPPGSDWHPWRLEYHVHELIAALPDALTPGRHRVALYRTLADPSHPPPDRVPLLEATFDLIVSQRALVFKTDINHPAPKHCDGAEPGDPGQLEVVQGDVPFDDGDSPATARAGGSVLLATGEELLERVDLHLPGVGMDFVFRRTYRSKVKYLGPLGHGWDFNWDDGLVFDWLGNVTRQNGRGRPVEWKKKLVAGTYETPPGHFSTLARVDTLYVLTEPDGTRRVYDPQGRLIEIADRNTNRMHLERDPETGNIRRVIDTTGRAITFTYEQRLDPDQQVLKWRLRKLTDYKNRVVEYVYDAAWNLIQVKAPLGRSERYEYMSSSDEDLNHNLTAVFGPLSDSVPKQRLVYGVLRAEPLTFDRVIREVDANGGVRTFKYSAEDGLLLVTVTEPNGVVHDHLIDADPTPPPENPPVRTNHELRSRVWTRRGQKQPELRPGEPDYYETRTHYDGDGRLFERVLPAGNREIYAYEAGARARERNVITVTRRAAGGAQLVTRYTYEARFNQLASVTDPRGTAPGYTPPLPAAAVSKRYTTTFTYDERGNLERVDHPVVHLEPKVGAPPQTQTVTTRFTRNVHGQVVDATNPEGVVTRHEYDARGYLRTTTVDPGGLNLRTEFTRDDVGNVIAVKDPGGTTTTFEVDDLNRVTRVVRDSGGANLETRYVHDAEGRVTSVFEEAPVGPGMARSELEHELGYDLLGNLRTRVLDVGDGTRQTWTYEYDRSNHLVLVTSPLGHKTRTQYDERDLLFKVTRGEGTGVASTVTIDYDLNGNRRWVRDGEQRATQFIYDSLDRLTGVQDAAGTSTILDLDPAGNVVATTVTGRPGPGATPGVLSHVLVDHDELGRPFRATQYLFGGGDVVARVIARTAYDRASRPTETSVTEALGATSGPEVLRRRTEVTYDRASRPTRTADDAANLVERKYDPNGNVTEETVTEVAPGTPPVEPQTFTTITTYDALNRPRTITDPAQQVTTLDYDRRGHLARRVDPGASVQRWEHDGLDRLRKEIRELKLPEGESGPLIGVTVAYAFDQDGRLESITDASGVKTSFQYDALDRLTTRTLPGGGTYTFTYDRADNVVETLDPNGTRTVRVYDGLNRLTTCAVLRGPGVEGTQAETYGYDGLSRLIQATSHVSSTDEETCRWTYDHLGRVLTETQGGKTVASTYAPAGGRMSVAYPGGRTLTFGLDDLQRPTSIREGTATLATFRWIGAGLRELRRSHGNTTLATYLDYDALQRVVRKRVFPGVGNPDLPPTTNPTLNRAYAYGPAGERRSETRHDDGDLRDEYEHDSLYRTTSSRFDLGPAVEGRRDLRSRKYTLDLAGNRESVTTKTQAPGDPSEIETERTYERNVAHQYTKITTEAATVERAHDANGNLRDDGTHLFFYDFKDRLVRVAKKAGGAMVAEYSYLPDGRRVQRRVHDGLFVTTRRSVWDGPQEVEEQDALGETVATYVWAPGYVDDLLQFQRTARHRLGAGTFYVHQDARHNVVAISDASGVVERRRFTDFGEQEVLGTPVDLDYGFQGRRLDHETGLYYFRARYYDPATGRFISRDPVWDPTNMGNPYTFVGNNPTTLTDPSGEAWFIPIIVAGLKWAGIAGGTALASDLIAQGYTQHSAQGINWTGNEYSPGALQVSGTAAAYGFVGGVTFGAGVVGFGALGASPLAAEMLAGPLSVGAMDLARGEMSHPGWYAAGILAPAVIRGVATAGARARHAGILSDYRGEGLVDPASPRFGKLSAFLERKYNAKVVFDERAALGMTDELTRTIHLNPKAATWDIFAHEISHMRFATRMGKWGTGTPLSDFELNLMESIGYYGTYRSALGSGMRPSQAILEANIGVPFSQSAINQLRAGTPSTLASFERALRAYGRGYIERSLRFMGYGLNPRKPFPR
ncbi:MAG: DUF6531 domain-containing protein [Planctomycetes bacterium]|nr:DUF6531 domain-containing protein [Planctomycetota bacterium]